MSGTTTTRAARSPRASAPKDGRPWYAPRPRWYAIAGGRGAFLMRREKTPYSARTIANCDSLYQAEKLAAALNRGERAQARRLHEIAVRDTALARFGDVRHALRRLVDAVCNTRKPAFAKRAALELTAAMIEAGRVLGDEPTFAPGGEEVGRG